MSIERDFVLRALLGHNFLPIQKKAREELPPVFSSVTFSPDIARMLVAGKPRKAEGFQGYDSVEYKLTRFNGVSRSCSIPHPVAYAHAALCVHENWDELSYIANNKTSMIRPREHSDGRIIIMDYEKSFERSRRILTKSFGCRFMVHTDISNCFPSIYSHAISWAAVGFDHAKKHKPPKHKDEWFNQLDEKVRALKRGETQGVAIGPATSNIVSEAILARIDESLRDDFVYTRFIDDYTAYCETEAGAQEFVRRLSEELAKYKLLLNIRKTEIVPLPEGLGTDWVAEIALALPKGESASAFDAMNYLNFAVEMSKRTPDGSVLKYALKGLLRKQLNLLAQIDVLRYALNLSFHQPVLLPVLDRLFDATVLPGEFRFGSELQRLLFENAQYRRSDGMTWSLFYLNKFNVKIGDECAAEVLASRDCMALLMLYLSGDAHYQAMVVDFASGVDSSDLYELDQYWILCYQLFLDGNGASPYPTEDAFEVLRDGGVSFTESPGISVDKLREDNEARLFEELSA